MSYNNANGLEGFDEDDDPALQAFDPDNLGEVPVVPHVDNITLLAGLINTNFEDIKGLVAQIVEANLAVMDRVEQSGVSTGSPEDAKLGLFRKRCEAIREVTGVALSEEAALKVYADIFGAVAVGGQQVHPNLSEPRAAVEQVRQMIAPSPGVQVTMTGPQQLYAAQAGAPVANVWSPFSTGYGATIFGGGR